MFFLGADNIGTGSLTMNANADVLSFLANSDGSSILDDSDLFSSDLGISSISNVVLANQTGSDGNRFDEDASDENASDDNVFDENRSDENAFDENGSDANATNEHVFDENGLDFLHQSFADFGANNDPSLFLTDTASPEPCLSPSSKLRKVRMRSESCSNPERQKPSQLQSMYPSQEYKAAQEKIRKRWCSFKTLFPAGKYPVCRNGQHYRDDPIIDRPLPAASLLPVDRLAPYKSIVGGTLSKFFAIYFSFHLPPFVLFRTDTLSPPSCIIRGRTNHPRPPKT